MNADTVINTQNLPATASWTAITCGLLLLYGIDTSGGLFPHSAQGACISLAAAGSIASILMTLGVKRVSLYLRKQVRPPNTIRMSLLGLVLCTCPLLHHNCSACMATAYLVRACLALLACVLCCKPLATNFGFLSCP